MKPICPTAQSMAVPLWRRKIAGNYEIHPETGCWEWTGRVDRYGYGKVDVSLGGRNRQTGAHRAAWIVHHGPILGALQLDHLCRNRRCINPLHLEPVTSAENTRRGVVAGSYGGPGIGRPRTALNDRVACSKHGTQDGKWRVRRDGYTIWHCRPCNQARMAAWKARRAA